LKFSGTMTREESLLQFPCSFPIKAMGKAETDFDAVVVEIVRRHAPDLMEIAVVTRPSKGGKWVSVTVTIQATSQKQLDAIYQALSDHDQVVMAL
jgi:putative lipoic acid-binding regulatory protein